MGNFKECSKEELDRMTDEEFDVYEKARNSEKSDEVSALIGLGFTNYVNDHHSWKEDERLQAIVHLDNGNVCPVYPYSLCCLNRLYVSKKDGKIHLSTLSVGGNFGKCLGETDGTVESFMKEAIEYYNTKSHFSAKIVGYKII